MYDDCVDNRASSNGDHMTNTEHGEIAVELKSALLNAIDLSDGGDRDKSRRDVSALVSTLQCTLKQQLIEPPLRLEVMKLFKGGRGDTWLKMIRPWFSQRNLDMEWLALVQRLRDEAGEPSEEGEDSLAFIAALPVYASKTDAGKFAQRLFEINGQCPEFLKSHARLPQDAKIAWFPLAFRGEVVDGWPVNAYMGAYDVARWPENNARQKMMKTLARILGGESDAVKDEQCETWLLIGLVTTNDFDWDAGCGVAGRLGLELTDIAEFDDGEEDDWTSIKRSISEATGMPFEKAVTLDQSILEAEREQWHELARGAGLKAQVGRLGTLPASACLRAKMDLKRAFSQDHGSEMIKVVRVHAGSKSLDGRVTLWAVAEDGCGKKWGPYCADGMGTAYQEDLQVTAMAGFASEDGGEDGERPIQLCWHEDVATLPVPERPFH